MTGIALDDNNDIFLDENRNIALCRDIEAVKTSVSCATKTNYGEIVLNTRLGIPFFETIFTAHPDIDLWMSFMKQAILSIPKVLGIIAFKTNEYRKDKVLKYAVVINTEYGEAEING